MWLEDFKHLLVHDGETEAPWNDDEERVFRTNNLKKTPPVQIHF